MKMRTGLMTLFLLCLLSIGQTGNSTQTESPQALVDSLIGTVKKVYSDKALRESKDNKSEFKKRRDHNRKYALTVSKKIDFSHICLSAMPEIHQSKYWTTASIKQQFVNLFQNLVEEIVYPKAAEFFKDARIDYNKPKYEGKKAYLGATIKEHDDKIELEFWFERDGTGWKIVDISVEGEAWVSSFRDQFNHIIVTESYESLLSKMQRKLTLAQEANTF